MPAHEIVELRTGDLTSLDSLLQRCGLPADDIAERGLKFIGVFDDGRLAACGGLEPAGDYVLLRSLAVDPGRRGRGMASAIVAQLIACARRRHYRALYLLTESADEFFLRFGFEAVARNRVPREIAATRQFADLCPASARCLVLPLAGS